MVIPSFCCHLLPPCCHPSNADKQGISCKLVAEWQMKIENNSRAREKPQAQYAFFKIPIKSLECSHFLAIFAIKYRRYVVKTALVYKA